VAAGLAAAVYVAAFLAATLLMPPDGRQTQLLLDLVYMGPALIAAPLAVVVALGRRADRLFWIVMAASLVAGLAGDMSWAVYDLILGQAPTPWPADAFYVANVALVVPAALIGFPPTPARRREAVDLLVPLVALAFVVYEFVLEPQVRGGITGTAVASVAECVIAVIAALIFTALIAGYRNIAASALLLYAAVLAQGISYPVYTYAIAPGGRLDGIAPYVGVGTIAAVVLRLRELVGERGRLAVELRRSLAAQERLATTDPLTEVANRRAFDELVGGTLAAAAGSGGTVGLVILDIDRFKGVNDGYGHPAGDEALRQVAARLRAAVRSGDTLARLGGEEFLCSPLRRALRRSASWASAAAWPSAASRSRSARTRSG
jgi:hypothetical protein